MTESESRSGVYPEYDLNGIHNPIRLPVTEESEHWEKEAALAMEEFEQSGKPRYAFGGKS